MPNRPNDQEIANAYNAARATGDRPIADVAARFGVSRATAIRWISTARDSGLVDDTIVAYAHPLIAVARDLGVEPAALYEAVSRLPGGALHVVTGSGQKVPKK